MARLGLGDIEMKLQVTAVMLDPLPGRWKDSFLRGSQSECSNGIPDPRNRNSPYLQICSFI